MTASVFVGISVDGFMARPNGDLDWLPEGGAPARACVQANMADPRHLVEIMITACR